MTAVVAGPIASSATHTVSYAAEKTERIPRRTQKQNKTNKLCSGKKKENKREEEEGEIYLVKEYFRF